MKHRPKPTEATYQLIHPLAPAIRGFCIVHVQHAEKNFHFFFEIRGNQKKMSFISRIYGYVHTEPDSETERRRKCTG